MKSGLGKIVLAACAMAFAGTALADELYGYDVPKKYPSVMKAYQALLPKTFRKLAWAYKLDGTSDPVAQKTIGGAAYLSIWSCKPHDCGGNAVALLATPDGSRVVAEIVADGVNDGNGQYFGDPSDDERAELDARLQ